VSGGGANTNTGNFATVAGGQLNSASGQGATLGGGVSNRVGGQYATIAGGAANTNNSSWATIGGGTLNTADSSHATVAGGYFNYAGSRCSVGGGSFNSASGQHATVPGGNFNIAAGDYSLAAGQTARAFHDGTFVWSDSQPGAPQFTSTGTNQFLIRASGGVGINTASPRAGLEVAGHWDGENGALTLSGDKPSLRLTAGALGGNESWLMHVGSEGPGNLGFFRRAAPAVFQPVLTLTPAGNVGIGTTTPSSRLDLAGTMSFGASFGPKLNLFNTDWGFGIQNGVMYSRAGTFAWYSGGSHNDNTFNPGPGGVVRMILSSGGLSVNGTFVSASDRNLKTGFAPVNAREILEKVARLPIARWSYTNDAATPHLGPVAQDFHAAFEVGADDRHIATVDADGVALAAIQGLNQKVEEKEERIRELERTVSELKQLVQSLHAKQNKP
jgi:hypothetical protein